MSSGTPTGSRERGPVDGGLQARPAARPRRGRAALGPLALAFAAGLALFLVSLPFEHRFPGFVEDHGPIQIGTLIVLIAAAVLAVWRAWHGDGRRPDLWLAGYILLFYAAREGDLHRVEIYPVHVVRVEFFQSDQVALLDKLVIGALLGSLLAAMLTLAVRLAPAFSRAIRRLDDWAVYLVVWFSTLLTTQALDHSALNFVYYGRALEESCELVAALVIGLVVWSLPSADRHRPV